MSAVCDSCGRAPTSSGLVGFKLTARVAEREFAIVARLCGRGCAELMREWKSANRTTEPPDIKTMWGGQELKPLRTGGERG